MHLSVAHFSEQLLARHPFSKDTECTLCVQEKRAKVPLPFLFLLVVYLPSCSTLSKPPPCQVFLMERKAAYAKHLGQLHLLVLELVTPEQRELLQPGKRGRKAKQPVTGG